MTNVPKYRHGAQNAYDSPSKATLENEFGTHNEDECLIKILENGTLQETEVGRRELPHQLRMIANVFARVDSGRELRTRVWAPARLTERQKVGSMSIRHS